MKLYQAIYRELVRQAQCNEPWKTEAEERLQEYEKLLPSGSGFDSGTTIFKYSKPNQFQLSTEYHHMNEFGAYVGWSRHIITVKPAFGGFEFTISGRDKNGIKAYIADIFHEVLNQDLQID